MERSEPGLSASRKAAIVQAILFVVRVRRLSTATTTTQYKSPMAAVADEKEKDSDSDISRRRFKRRSFKERLVGSFKMTRRSKSLHALKSRLLSKKRSSEPSAGYSYDYTSSQSATGGETPCFKLDMDSEHMKRLSADVELRSRASSDNAKPRKHRGRRRMVLSWVSSGSSTVDPSPAESSKSLFSPSVSRFPSFRRRRPATPSCQRTCSPQPANRAPTVAALAQAIGSSFNMFARFGCVPKAYTLNNGVGGDDGALLVVKDSSLVVHWKVHMAARALITRRASFVEASGQGPKVRGFSRQATVSTPEDQDTEQTKCRSPKLKSRQQTLVSEKQPEPPERRRLPHRFVRKLPGTSDSDEKCSTLWKKRLPENMKRVVELQTFVEQDDIGNVRSMLEKGTVDVHAENIDELTALDIALMLNHVDVALLLLKHGAQQNSRLNSTDLRLKKLQSLSDGAQTRLAQLKVAQVQATAVPNNILASSMKSNSSSLTNVADAKDTEKQLTTLESRLHMYKKMRKNVEAATTPGAPEGVLLHVAGPRSLIVSVEPPSAVSTTPTTATCYKVEWSTSPTFETIEGCMTLTDLRRLELTMGELEQSVAYYVRVSAGNFVGFGPPALSQPPFAVPSSWREAKSVSQNEIRRSCHLQNITELYHDIDQMRNCRDWITAFAAAETGAKRKKSSSIRNLFSAGNKFVKTPKKGVYLASIIYKEQKIVSTVDDNLPMVLVDENEPVNFGADFNWFMKVSCNWDDSKWLSQDFSEIGSSSHSLNFRTKLLVAASQMQAGLGLVDIGRLHNRPLSDHHGTTIFVTVQYLSDSKAMQGLAVKWVPMTKLLRKRSSPNVCPTSLPASECLLHGLLEFLNFFESTYVPLDKGLYLGYLKMHASMNDISVVVPENLPSVLPFVYIRPNPHVSREEWAWLQMLEQSGECDVGTAQNPTNCQLAFHWALVSAAKILLDDLEVSSEQIPSHRLYSLEVVEVHADVSLLLIVPQSADVCTAPCQHQGQQFYEEKRGCLSLSIPVFEMAHFCTYQPDFISTYCRLATFLDYFSLILTQLQRRMLSDDDAQLYRHMAAQIAVHQTRLEHIWKEARWITNVASMARDRQQRCGVTLATLFAYSPPPQQQPVVATDAPPPPPPAADDEVAEDNSDVGYHSDQSVDKRSQATLSQPVENPIYALTDNLPSTSTAFCSKQSYMNLPSKPQSLLAGDNHGIGFCDSDCSSPLEVLTPRTFSFGGVGCSSPSYLHAAARRRRFLVPPGGNCGSFGSLTTHRMLPVGGGGGAATAPHSPPSPLTANRRRVHEYVNVPSHSHPPVTSSDSDHSCHSAIQVASTGRLSPRTQTKLRIATKGTVSDTEVLKSRHTPPFAEDLSLIDRLYVEASRHGSPVASSTASTVTSGSAPVSPILLTPLASPPAPLSPTSAIVRVYAAYPCGLAKGSSVKLQITPATTAKEVVMLVVIQLRKAVKLRNKKSHFSASDEGEEGEVAEPLDSYCLVAVIGARERCLRDDFCPLRLQNPWLKGKLFVRRRDNLLAALEHGNEALV